MKHILLSFFLLSITLSATAQGKKISPFITGSFDVSFTVNENFTLGEDDGESFLIPTGTFFRFGAGYEFHNRFLLSLNAGYDYHFPYAINAFPTYVAARYNIWNNEGDAFFIQYGRGKMWRPSFRYSDGDYYQYVVGWEFESDSRWKPMLQLSYHRKHITGFEDRGVLESLSLGIAFRFF